MGTIIQELQAENLLLKKELKEIKEKLSEEGLLLEQAITNISTRFVNLKTHRLDFEIDRALNEAGLFTGTDRAYVFLYDYENKEISNTNEWCAPGIKTKIDRLKNNIVFLRNIIDKTLNLSRIESGKIIFSPALENLNLLVLQVIEKVSELFNHNHKVNFKGVPGSAVLKIDKQMIDEVISNLLTNSFKYSDPGTTIDIIIEETGKGLAVEITDRGIGIPEEIQNNIFDAFRRGPNVGNIHGTGLGLAISKKFTEMNGGNITFYSEVNKGTTFTVLLPWK